MRKALYLLLIGAFSYSGAVLAFDNKETHRDLTYAAALQSSLDSLLRDSLGLSQGLLTDLGPNSDGNVTHEAFSRGREWLREGSYSEDVPPCRASNHFHNPLRDWAESGMRDQPGFVNLRCSATEYPPENIKSAVHWATGYTQASPGGAKVDTGNIWNWDRAREYYYICLAGMNFQGEQVAFSESQRKAYLASSLQTLGQVVHLLEDMAVPAHVRDDFKSHLEWNGITSATLFGPSEWVIEKFEYFVKKEGISSGDPVRPAFQNPSLTAFWDTNQYTGQDPDLLDSRSVGLAEYTNMNFASKNTIFSEDFLSDSDPSNDVYYHPYPRKGSVDINDYVNHVMLPETVIGEDDQSDLRFYMTKKYDGEFIYPFLAATYLTRDVQTEPGVLTRVFYKTLRIDDECVREYARKLVPRAVGYSAALLDYFFRGKLDVKAIPVYGNDAVTALKIRIKNVTASQETMSSGELILGCAYRDSGTGEERFAASSAVQMAGPLPFEGVAQNEFTLSEPIPVTDFGSIKCMLAFRGTLGNEEGAVIGKYVPLNKFDEEWDNGLYGNYPWVHTTAADQTAYGVTQNAIEVVGDPPIDRLVKDNVRWQGYSAARVNESYFIFKDAQSPTGLFISPNTRLQFKIDALSINAVPPAPPDMTSNLQALMLNFNNGRKMQFSKDEQFMYFNNTTVYFNFPSGAAVDLGIYELFQAAEIQLVEPLYLENIDFVQQLLDLEDPSPEEHHQHMEVDYIRIVEPNN